VTGDESLVKEPTVNDSEEQVCRLLTLAAEDVPPDIDLLRGVRALRRARRVRARLMLAATTAVALAVVLVVVLVGTTAITLSVSRAPSARAAVIAGADRTAARSYHVSETFTFAVTPPDTFSPSRVTMTGMFDPARGVGEESGPDAMSIRWIGGYVYLRSSYDGKPWVRFRRSAVRVSPGPPRFSLGQVVVGLDGPQGLLTALKSASRVRAVGPASGPGWTGTRYAFTATSTKFGFQAVFRIGGTVDIDRQGRVRRLDATEVLSYPGHAQAEFRTGIDLAFSDFGAPVSVAPPPASETYISNAGRVWLPG
jgi:hypothetical protein